MHHVLLVFRLHSHDIWILMQHLHITVAVSHTHVSQDIV